jgi:anaerobic magnesium-protoporphyrin IX monomethyl ester cyclase
MRVLLIDPPFYRIFGFYNRYFPVGLATLGTVLRDAGHTVSIYDADANYNPTGMDYTRLPEMYRLYLDSFNDQQNPIWNEVKKTIRDFNPDVVGIANWTTFAASAFYLAKIVKEIQPSCHVIMGGPHATSKADEILNLSEEVDCVVKGEGEITTLELLKYFESGGDLNAIQGIAFRENGAIKITPRRKTTKNLDIFGIPDRSLLMNESKYTSEDMGLIMTSRGCPYGCTYCATETRMVGYRSVDHVLKEIKLVKDRYGTSFFSFKDDSFTVSRKRVEELCQKLIEGGFHVQWECNTRVNLIDEPLLELMKKAGCCAIKVGIESGSKEF